MIEQAIASAEAGPVIPLEEIEASIAGSAPIAGCKFRASAADTAFHLTVPRTVILTEEAADDFRAA